MNKIPDFCFQWPFETVAQDNGKGNQADHYSLTQKILTNNARKEDWLFQIQVNIFHN